MADFPTIQSQPEEGFKAGEVFNAGQVDNFIIGVNRGFDGMKQALTEAKEILGLAPEGQAEFDTQEMIKDQEILREAAADDQKLQGAGVSEFVGEALPLFAVPFGGSAKGAAALGGAASSMFFQDDVSESRLDDIAIGAVGGGVLGKLLLRGGKAKQQAEKAIGDMENAGFVGPRDFMGPRPAPAAPPVRGQNIRDFIARQKAGKVQAAQAGRQGALQNIRQAQLQPFQKPAGLFDSAPQNIQETIQKAGLTAADFQGAGRSPIPGFQGVPKPRVRQQLSPAQKAMTAPKSSPVMVEKAMRKAEVFARNAARKAKKLEKSVEKAMAKGSKPHVVAKLRKEATEALKDKVAATAMARAFQSLRQGSRAPLGEAAKGQADAFTKASRPRVRVGAESGKAQLTGPAAVAQDVKPPMNPAEVQRILDFGTKADMVRAILRLNPKARGLAKMRKDELSKALSAARGSKAGGPGGKQAGFINTDLQAGLSGMAVGAGLGAATTDSPYGAGAGALAGAFLGVRGARLLDKATTNKMREGMRKAEKEGGEFTAKVTRNTKAKDFSGQAINAVLTDGRRTLDSFLGATMTRIEQISPKIGAALRAAEFQQHFRKQQYKNQTDAIFKRLDDAELTDVQQRSLKIALLNSTRAAKAYLSKIGKTDAAAAMDDFDKVLEHVGGYLGEVNLGGNLRRNYFPRQVIDSSGFDNIVEVKTYLDQLAKKKGIDLTDFEKEQAITQVINGALNRSNDNTAFGRASANLKKRTVKVDSKNVDAYADPKEAMHDYLDSITTQVERRRFFQGQGVGDDLGPNAENMDAVATKLKEQLKGGDMTKEQVDEVAMLLRSRFGPGEQAPHKAVQHFKNLTYAGLLGNPISAMTQFGDMAISAHKNGIRNTVKAMMEEIAGRGKTTGLDKELLLGIEGAATDFASRASTKKMLNWSLEKGQFARMDTLGKNTFIGAAMKKAKQQSPEDFNSQWRNIFDPEAPPGGPTPRTDALYQKVQNFQEITPENREDIGFMLWNSLSDAQPIALSSMPEQYLKNPNGRMAYMLQSFTLKMFDIMRKDIYNKFRAGDRIGAIKDATNFTTLFVAMNGSVDTAKDFVLGKETDGLDTVVDNYLKLLGMNKFMFDRAGKEGIGSAIKGSILPTALLDATTDSKKAVGMLPIGGRIAVSPRFTE